MDSTKTGLEKRVKNVLDYKKPTFWIVILAVILCIVCIVAAICFLTNSITKNTVLMGADYDIEKVIYSSNSDNNGSSDIPFQYCISADYHLYYLQDREESREYIGALAPYDLTNEELDGYISAENLGKRVKISNITDAYTLQTDNGIYYAFQTAKGKTYIAYVSDGRLSSLCLLKSSFAEGSFDVGFFDISLTHMTGENVNNFAYYQVAYKDDDNMSYSIVGFKAGESPINSEMTDFGFAVFQSAGDGFRLIDMHLYKDAVLSENGIYCCEDLAIADVNGKRKDGNTFAINLVYNKDIYMVEKVYWLDGKKAKVQKDMYVGSLFMSVWSLDDDREYDAIKEYFYDKEGNIIAVK